MRRRIFMVTNYPGGLDVRVEEIRPHLGHQLVQEGLWKIAEKFASPEHMLPKFVADFEGIRDRDERAVRIRDAYERVNYLLSALGAR